MCVCVYINIPAYTEGKAARVIRLQQHMRKGSIQDSSTITALLNSKEHFIPHYVDPQSSAGSPSDSKTIMCHHKTCSALPFNTCMLFLKDSLQKPAPPVVTILPLFPSPNGEPMLSLVPTLSFK